MLIIVPAEADAGLDHVETRLRRPSPGLRRIEKQHDLLSSWQSSTIPHPDVSEGLTTEAVGGGLRSTSTMENSGVPEHDEDAVDCFRNADAAPMA